MSARASLGEYSSLKELSGPRPSHRVTDKPRVWGWGAAAISPKDQPTFQISGLGRTITTPTPGVSVTPAPGFSNSLVHAMRSFSDVGSKSRLMARHYDINGYNTCCSILCCGWPPIIRVVSIDVSTLVMMPCFYTMI